MTTFQTNDGEVFTATSPTETLEKLRLKSFNPCASLEEFRADLVERVSLQTGATLDDVSDEAIVQGLVSLNLLQPIGD